MTNRYIYKIIYENLIDINQYNSSYKHQLVYLNYIYENNTYLEDLPFNIKVKDCGVLSRKVEIYDYPLEFQSEYELKPQFNEHIIYMYSKESSKPPIEIKSHIHYSVLETNHTREKYYLPINIYDSVDLVPFDKISEYMDVDSLSENINIDNNYSSNSTESTDLAKDNNRFEYIVYDNCLIIRSITSDSDFNIIHRMVESKDYEPKRGDVRISFYYKMIPPKMSLIGGVSQCYITYYNYDFRVDHEESIQHQKIISKNCRYQKFGLYHTFEHQPYNDILFIMPGMYKVDEILFFNLGQPSYDYILSIVSRVFALFVFFIMSYQTYFNYEIIIQQKNVAVKESILVALMMSLIDILTIYTVQLFRFNYYRNGLIIMSIEIILMLNLGIYIYVYYIYDYVDVIGWN